MVGPACSLGDEAVPSDGADARPRVVTQHYVNYRLFA